MSKKVSGRQAAVDFLREKGGGPLPVKEITAEAASRAKLAGKTPQATIAAQIYTAAKKGVLFKIAERGMVALLPEAEPGETSGDAPEETAASDDEESIAADLARGTAAVSGRAAKPDPKPARQSKSSRKRAAVIA